MNKKSTKIFLVLVILWLGTLFLLASHTNVKGYSGEPGPVFFTDSRGYNFEYKLGFPTPWYSKYYRLTDKQLIKSYEHTTIKTCRLFDKSCANVTTPPASSLVWQDKSFNILALQAVLALIPFSLVGLMYYGVSKYAHTWH